MDLFWSSPLLLILACLVVRLYLHGRVRLFPCLVCDLFGELDLFGYSPLTTLASLGVRLYLHVFVLVFAFTFIGLFGCSPVSTWTC